METIKTAKDLKAILEDGSVTSVIVRTHIDYNDPGSDWKVYITDPESRKQLKHILEKELSLMKRKRKKEIQEEIDELKNELENID